MKFNKTSFIEFIIIVIIGSVVSLILSELSVSNIHTSTRDALIKLNDKNLLQNSIINSITLISLIIITIPNNIAISLSFLIPITSFFYGFKKSTKWGITLIIYFSLYYIVLTILICKKYAISLNNAVSVKFTDIANNNHIMIKDFISGILLVIIYLIILNITSNKFCILYKKLKKTWNEIFFSFLVILINLIVLTIVDYIFNYIKEIII